MRPWKNLTSGIKSHKQAVTKRCSGRNFTKFTGKHLCQSLFFNNPSGLRPATLLRKTLAQVFVCELCEISKNFFSDKTEVAASGLTCKAKSSNLSIQDLLCLFFSEYRFILKIFLFKLSSQKSFLCFKELLYSFVSMLFLKRAVKS